jgi:hypothetical protein
VLGGVRGGRPGEEGQRLQDKRAEYEQTKASSSAATVVKKGRCIVEPASGLTHSHHVLDEGWVLISFPNMQRQQPTTPHGIGCVCGMRCGLTARANTCGLVLHHVACGVWRGRGAHLGQPHCVGGSADGGESPRQLQLVLQAPDPRERFWTRVGARFVMLVVMLVQQQLLGLQLLGLQLLRLSVASACSRFGLQLLRLAVASAFSCFGLQLLRLAVA